MDRRKEKTEQAIVNAFIELRAKKDLEKITVKELCQRAEINKSTFYAHFQDIFQLSEYLEEQVACEIVASVIHPERLFTDPESFNRELFDAYLSQEPLLRTLFSGSRGPMLPARIEASLKEVIFSLRPDYRDNPAANVLFTQEIYGGFYSFEKCRHFGDEQVVRIMSEINRKGLEAVNDLSGTENR